MLHRTALSLASILLAGCLPAIPNPYRYGVTPGVAAIDAPEVGVSAACCYWPALGVDYVRPLGEGPLTLELQAQGSWTGATTSPALWLRSGRGELGPAFGARVGAIGGVGDVLGLTGWRQLSAGGSLHGQYAYRWENGRIFAATAGAEASFPLNYAALGTVPVTGYYGTLDAWAGLPVNERAMLGVGLGIDVWLGGLALPQASAELRF